ncbi:flagellar hook assembly protein FlgD [Novosphingobium sp. 9U]|uniref:flagellar hook assembly protein FlgD n=1 Tax=Novosphingobium sp. 9U TaxID=2653158 RepID=UPI0012F1C8B6|nr:flagellar hook capping FlgD N-terminal domain-containing protein [Novosphingobium sp. 9U]VWX53036.1 Flagellar basal body rod modification protein FlgD [Novosphingobium sp. 9U]
MTVSSVFSNYSTTSTAAKTDTSSSKGGLASLGANDFIKLMTAQMQQQDPTDPVDQKQMLSQMAQFSTLANSTEMGSTLSAIAGKLDVLISKTAANNSTAS